MLYADVSGFTAYSNRVKDPAKVVNMLKSFFEMFDDFCLEHNVFKLFTIGDCYVVMGFIDANRRNDKDPECIQKECKNVTEMGI